MGIDQYARDCHTLITVEKGIDVNCQSTSEILSTRVVELLDKVAALKKGRPSIDGKALTQMDVHNLVVDRDRARRDLRQSDSKVTALETENAALGGYAYDNLVEARNLELASENAALKKEAALWCDTTEIVYDGTPYPKRLRLVLKSRLAVKVENAALKARIDTLEAKVSEIETDLSQAMEVKKCQNEYLATRLSELYAAQDKVAALETDNAALRKAAEPRPMGDAPKSIDNLTMEAAQCLGLHDHDAQGADIEYLGSYLRAAFELGSTSPPTDTKAGE